MGDEIKLPETVEEYQRERRAALREHAKSFGMPYESGHLRAEKEAAS